MAGSPRLRALSILFVAVLATYSGVWMYYIRMQNLANVRGFEYVYRPSARDMGPTMLPRAPGCGPTTASWRSKVSRLIAIACFWMRSATRRPASRWSSRSRGRTERFLSASL
jgi:hypothetical protein